MTLTEAAFWSKRFGIIILAVVGFIFVMLLIIASPSTNDIPLKYLTPNYACTETADEFLEYTLNIPSLEVLPSSEMTFDIQTASGKIDDDEYPSIVNVYRYTNLGQVLNSQLEAKVLAKKMGFDENKIVRRGTTEYIWVNNTTQRSLSVNARDLNFTMKTDAERVRNVRKNGDLPSELESISLATNALRTLGVLDVAYTEMQPVVHFVDINPDGSYSEADSLLNAELIRIDFQKKIPMITIESNLQGADQMVAALEKRNLTYETGTQVVNGERVEVYNFSTLMTYQNPLKSNVTVYVGADDSTAEILPNIFQIDFRTWSLEIESCGTYELVSPSIALQEIENGNGSLVFLNYNQDEVVGYVLQSIKNLAVNDIYLTYYEGLLEQPYLQPVYMVEGEAELDNGDWADFHIYYPAINYGIVQNKQVLEPPPVKEESILSF